MAIVYWWWVGRPALPRRLLAVTCAGIAVFGVVAVYQARPYLKVSHDYPTARRKILEVKRYSAGPRAFLAASSENRVWGYATASIRAGVKSRTGDALFPGATIFLHRAARTGRAVVHDDYA